MLRFFSGRGTALRSQRELLTAAQDNKWHKTTSGTRRQDMRSCVGGLPASDFRHLIPHDPLCSRHAHFSSMRTHHTGTVSAAEVVQIHASLQLKPSQMVCPRMPRSSTFRTGCPRRCKKASPTVWGCCFLLLATAWLRPDLHCNRTC